MTALCYVAESRGSIRVEGDINGDELVDTLDVRILVDYLTQRDTSALLCSYEVVDLGLPSGLLWCAVNVGAETPSQSGGYYAWGETEEKDTYTWDNYKWCNADTTLTRYCRSTTYGPHPDNLDALLPDDDVAHMKMGGVWRMPSFTELYELYKKCKWTVEVRDSVNGFCVTGPNGNSIFLPMAGYCDGEYICNEGTEAFYWASTLDYTDDMFAYGLYAVSYYQWWGIRSRYTGHTVRACMYPLSYFLDLNGDGRISISDLTYLTRIIEEKSHEHDLPVQPDWMDEVWE